MRHCTSHVRDSSLLALFIGITCICVTSSFHHNHLSFRTVASYHFFPYQNRHQQTPPTSIPSNHHKSAICATTTTTPTPPSSSYPQPKQGDENLSHRAYAEEKLFNKHSSFLTAPSENERSAAKKRVKTWLKTSRRGPGGPKATLGGGGGFGSVAATAAAAKIARRHEYMPHVDKGGYGAVVIEEGVVRINDCLSRESTAGLLSYINADILRATADATESSTSLSDEIQFANVLSKKNRWDMMLPLDQNSIIANALWELLAPKSALSNTIESVLGPKAQLYELAALVSDPGSDPQVLHPDFPITESDQLIGPTSTAAPAALTCFVSLQDISPDMGPTTFLPRSATEAHHADLKQRLWDFHSTVGPVAETPVVRNCLGEGDVSLYNPATLHCGGGNRSERRRVLFYFSFRDVVADPNTEGASLREDVALRGLTLATLRDLLTEWQLD